MDSSLSCFDPADRMDSSVLYFDAAECMEAARIAVHKFEGDSAIINERYNKKEYRARRTHHLGRIEGASARVLPIATADAELVFESQPDILSVQTVRARELSCNLDPLLPFPTRQNCDTITNFDEYSSEEWKPSDPPTFPRDHQNSPPRSYPDVPDRAAQDALLQIPRLLHSQQTTDLFPAPLDGTINPRLLSTVGMAPALLNPPSPETLRQVVFDLQFPLGTVERPLPKYRAEEGVASLSGRGIYVPVKTPPKSDGKKREVSEIDDDGSEHLESNDDDQAIELEPAVRSQNSRPPERPRKKTKKSQVSATHGRPKAPKVAASRSRAVSEKPNVKWLSAVSGNRLPKTVREAQEAAVERKRVLEEAHMIKNRTARNLDFVPEFFNTYNFSEDERANFGKDSGPIRCICDEGEDASMLDWIQCDSDECGVWQHVECMGDAVPEDPKKREAVKYLCQVCDPWKHRRTIQTLRRLNPDPILAATKAEPVDDD